MKNVIILGSTGSVGENAVRVACALSRRIRVVGIVGNSNLKRLAQQAALLKCEFAATGDESRGAELASLLPSGCRAFAGKRAVEELVRCPGVDMVLCAIVGTAGLPPVLAAIDSGKDIAPFCTSGGSGITTAVRNIAEMEGDADVFDGLRVSAGNPRSALVSWLTAIGSGEH